MAVIGDMPPGTLGFRFVGEVTGDDYRKVLEPALEEVVSRGEPLRVLVHFDTTVGALGPGAIVEDARTGWKLGVRHRQAWERTALVSDADWTRHAGSALGWMVPGDFRVFPSGAWDEARAWVAGGAD
jgi:hypothetical protein